MFSFFYVCFSSPQRRGLLWVLAGILLLCTIGEFSCQRGLTKTTVDTTDYLVLRQWAVHVQDSLQVASVSTVDKKWPREDLNTTTALALQRVKGIGVVLSRRIILYREALGGFYTMDQLAEIQGLGVAVRARLQARYKLKRPVVCAPLHVNRLCVESITLHPYIPHRLALQVVKERPFVDILAFKSQLSLSDEDMRRLRPYVSFSP